MVSCAAYSYLVVGHLEVVPRQYIASSQQLVKIIALATIFCLTVVLGNMSLRYIPVSFNQAIGATTPVFTSLFSFCFTWQAETLSTYLTLIPVVLGIIIASNSEPSWHTLGVILCFASVGGTVLCCGQRVLPARLLLECGTF